ncbi:MAG: CoA-binding protein [Cytophagaceae bacterium]|nr:CoA-binding protein [Cytophagaceae bacterium]MBK9511564.1 CoA-binding protein [Cytophagaceae bacterium]MBK9932949.1 CoA-binding protein [Cytophagaceae bacterium]MBL0303339.1 CoA-binding protein [Cytophagaceae bacterium]MBL0326189.1 CoA-binding protein [Cytophagaceae bacterium]
MGKKKTLIMGASTKPGRYALIATEMLDDYGHPVVLFGKKEGKVRGIEILTQLEDIPADIDTVTMYLGEDNQVDYEDFIVKLKPKRVIFNPGAENFDFENRLESEGIEPIEACTLVLLSTGQY